MAEALSDPNHGYKICDQRKQFFNRTHAINVSSMANLQFFYFLEINFFKARFLPFLVSKQTWH